MKNVLKTFGIIAILAVIVFSMAACGEKEEGDKTFNVKVVNCLNLKPDGTNSGYSPTITNITVYVSGSGGTNLLNGDTSIAISSERSFNVTAPSNGELIISVDFSPQINFNTGSGINIYNNIMTRLSSNDTTLYAVIGISNGMPDPELQTTDPRVGGNSNGGGGTFTLTGIPNEYNGKYMSIWGRGSSDEYIAGFQSFDSGTNRRDLVQIVNGSASTLMWTAPSTNVYAPVRYTGNDTIQCTVEIYSTPAMSTPDRIFSWRFSSVTFSNGSATRAWNQGAAIP